MFREAFLFEWRFFSRQPVFKTIVALIFSLGFLVTTVNKVSMGGANLLKNGPYAITFFSLFFSILAIFFIAFFVANTALRNEASRMGELLYSQPIHPFGYHAGRFLGSFSVVVAVFAGLQVGLLLGSLMPWVEASRLGPFQLQFYATTFLFFTVPTLFVFSALFYALARRFRSLSAVFFAALGCLFLYEISDGMVKSPESHQWAALLDPFCLRTFEIVSRYWTIFEKNHQPIALEGLLLQNRLLWLAIGSVILAVFGGFSQRFAYRLPRIKTGKRKRKETIQGQPAPGPLAWDGSFRNQPLRIWFAQTLFEVRQTLFSPGLLLLLSLVVLGSFLVFLEPSGMYGTPYWPFTFRMIGQLQNVLPVFIYVTIAFYAAEIVWRERQLGVADMVESYPVSNGSIWFSKLIALWTVIAFITCVGAVCAVSFQWVMGYTRIQPEQYLISLGLFSLLPWMMMAVLAFLLAVLSPNKYVAIFGFVLFLIVDMGLDLVGVQSHLLHFGQSPGFEYSDMNGYGGALGRHAWYLLYWGSLSMALCWLGFVLWQRGPLEPLIKRLRRIGSLLGRSGKRAIAVCVLVWLTTGGYIYYNTHILNANLPEELRLADRALYEKTYHAFREDPIPVMTQIDCQVAIYPALEKVVASADFTVHNASENVIERFLVAHPLFTQQSEVMIRGGRLLEEAGPFRTYWFKFDEPMQPGEKRQGRFEVTRQQKGFSDGFEDVQVVKNGTFINNSELFPLFGYRPDLRLADVHDRERFGLPVSQRLPSLEDERFHTQHFMGAMGSEIDFSATVSTSADQMAIAPGYLQQSWEEGGRRFFRYEMDAPMINFYAFTSARLASEKTVHEGVALEVYYHPDHGMNISSMMAAAKDTLDYMQEHFGPYQHRQFRVIEYPLYRKFAQSYANTVPFSELGFLFDLRNPNHIDPVYKSTSHELAHQWWGHQVGAGHVQGWEVLVESLTQYSAIMVLEKKFGVEKLRRFLKYELGGYLRGRTREVREESTLARSEFQPYIHYHKGSVAMMALRDLLGETRFNLALRQLLERYRFRADPYPTTKDLMAFIGSVAEDQEERAFIADTFEKIVLYDLKLKKGTVTVMPDGQFQVELNIDAQRYQADGIGREVPFAMDELIEIALFPNDPDDFTAKEQPLYLQKHRLRSGENTIKITLAQRPTFAGVDPFIKRIDRNTEDNLVSFD